MMQKHRFAPVVTFDILSPNLSIGSIVGYAAPAGGPLPCALVLAADSAEISVVRACSFSAPARDLGLRLGWCGFAMGGFAQGLAMGSDLEVRCWVSGRVLKQWTGAELAEQVEMPSRQPTGVRAMMERIHQVSGSTDFSEIQPFATRLLETRGQAATIETIYRYVLGRGADQAGVRQFRDTLVDGTSILAAVQILRNSDEYRLKSRPGLSGPFEPDFPFPLEHLDDPRAALLAKAEKDRRSTQ